jgi:hypothetical protein
MNAFTSTFRRSPEYHSLNSWELSFSCQSLACFDLKGNENRWSLRRWL